jgi:hypothetical protein
MELYRRFSPSPRARATVYILILLVINIYFVKKLFFVEFTNNMQTNAGSFMAITRFILQHGPHVAWFPWWFNGEPFENSYTPMLHMVDAGFAWTTGSSPAHAYNFVTAFFYVAGPVFLFLFAWRVSRFLETSFAAALLFSLFSPTALFPGVRADLGGLWNPWRLRVLVFWGEGPHTVVLSLLPLVLLILYLAMTKRTYIWYAAATIATAFLVLTNAFGAVDLLVSCGCLLLASQWKEIPRRALIICVIGIVSYLWVSPFLTPTLIRTISENSQFVGGDYTPGKMLPWRVVILAGLTGLSFATGRMQDYFTRFTLLITFAFLAIAGLALIANLAAVAQASRYSLEMELGVSLAAAFLLRPLLLRSSVSLRIIVASLLIAVSVHQIVYYRSYAKTIIQKVDVTQTIEYKIAKAVAANLGGLRAFVPAQPGTWLNVFADTPQMDSGHLPFNPNATEGAAAYAICSGQNAGTRDAENSILWLKAYGCHAVQVSGPKSRVEGKPFVNPKKFESVLPVLWHEEDDTIYSVPQRTRSLAHVVPLSAIVMRKPIHGLDTEDVVRYVAALDDPALPPAELTWRSPSEARINATVHPGQVVSVQSTYDKGWIASANGRPAEVGRDGIGLSVIYADCDGPCDIRFIFDGGLERRICRAASWTVTAGILIAGLYVLIRRIGGGRPGRSALPETRT